MEEKMGLRKTIPFGVCRHKEQIQGKDSGLFCSHRAPTVTAAILDWALCFPRNDQGGRYPPLFADEEMAWRGDMTLTAGECHS